MAAYEDLPYRTCVGMMVLNRDGLVFIGRRASGPEHVDAVHVWQMPQGGVVEKEAPVYSSRVMMVCPKCGRAARVGHGYLADGAKVRGEVDA